jgi:hypothetical protein
LSRDTVIAHKGRSKTVPSKWFDHQTAAISGVLFSNSGTAPKFNRMGAQRGWAPQEISLLRIGEEMDPTFGATEPHRFVENVLSVSEPWPEGLVLVHNPFAAEPLDPACFEGIATQIFLADDDIEISFVGRQIFRQLTLVGDAEHEELMLAPWGDYLDG